MILEKTRQALAVFFPQEASAPPQAAEEEAGAEDKKAKSKPQKRENGLIERDYARHGYHLDAQLAPEQLQAAVQVLDGLEFFLETITGVDWLSEQEMEVIYDFSRYDFDTCRVVLRTRVNRDAPEVPSITSVIAGANWHERETHDFFGIKFTGHPHLIPLLLPEDADFHPLRKDFQA